LDCTTSLQLLEISFFAVRFFSNSYASSLSYDRKRNNICTKPFMTIFEYRFTSVRINHVLYLLNQDFTFEYDGTRAHLGGEHRYQDPCELLQSLKVKSERLTLSLTPLLKPFCNGATVCTTFEFGVVGRSWWYFHFILLVFIGHNKYRCTET